MSITAVVLDIGSVLETIDDDVFPGPWEERLGLGPGASRGPPTLEASAAIRGSGR